MTKRPFYQTVILTGVATVSIGSAALAGDNPLGAAYNKLVAANTSIQQKHTEKAVDELEDARWSLRQNDILNKDHAAVQRDKALQHDIAAIVTLLKGSNDDRFEKAAEGAQKVQDDVEAAMTGKVEPKS